MNEKMNNQTLRASINLLNEATGKVFLVNSFDMGDNDKTQYGLVKKNKDGTMDLVLDAKYTKRQIFYHIEGYLIFNRFTVSTAIVDKAPKKKTTKKPTKK